eukprot:3148736-Prymnesium_polylepis.1
MHSSHSSSRPWMYPLRCLRIMIAAVAAGTCHPRRGPAPRCTRVRDEARGHAFDLKPPTGPLVTRGRWPMMSPEA